MINYKNDIDIISLFEAVEELRKKIKKDKKAMKYYYHLKELNKNDVLYSWLFYNDAMLTDDLYDFELYQKSYTIDILKVYKSELEDIINKKDL